MMDRDLADFRWQHATSFVANNISAYMIQRNMSTECVSTQIGCDENVIRGLLYGKPNCSIKAAKKIENKMGIDLSMAISLMEANPTLFNSSQSSGFVYKIVGCDVDGMHRLNYKEGFLDIISAIREEYSLEFIGCRNELFEQNIRVVDSRMDEILQNAILMQVGYLDGLDSTGIPEISKALAALNPIDVRNPEVFYEAKLKAFLFASFAGMTASTEWNGRKKLTGGYIDVDREGELLYYRAISDDIFESYLFKHTYVDRPDRGYVKDLAIAEAKAAIDENRSLTEEEIFWIEHSEKIDKKTNEKKIVKNAKKGDFGYVYQNGDDFYIVINFQVRFR